MDLRNCSNCGKMFQYVGDRVCPACRAELENKLDEVKKYIDEHDRVTVQVVSEELDVSVKQIRRWIQEDRLMFAPGVDTGLVCSKCGMPVESGSLCKRCKENLKNSFESVNQKMGVAVQKPQAKDTGSRMHLTKYNK